MNEHEISTHVNNSRIWKYKAKLSAEAASVGAL